MFVNFQDTFITWKTLKGSYGKFTAEAYLYYNNNEWLLGSEVMACDVYGKEKLFKDPYYSFQPLFSSTESRIFRTYKVSGETDHTSFQPSLQFQKHAVEIKKQREFEQVDLITEKNYLNPMQCKIDTKEYSLQFPVKHLNCNGTNGQFQIETGPIVFPYRNNLCKAYLAFNSLNKFEVLISGSENGVEGFLTYNIDNCSITIIKKL